MRRSLLLRALLTGYETHGIYQATKVCDRRPWMILKEPSKCPSRNELPATRNHDETYR